MKESVYVSMDVTRGNHLEREEKRREPPLGEKGERERDSSQNTKIRAHTSAAETKIYIYI